MSMVGFLTFFDLLLSTGEYEKFAPCLALSHESPD
jgi:hypothetical protein